MVSATQQTSSIRRRKQATNGKRNKRSRLLSGTPTFPVHLPGYDPSAPDAKRADASATPGSSSSPSQKS